MKTPHHRNTRAIFGTIPGALFAALLLVSPQQGEAGSATWKANPRSGDWNKAANWSPKTVPNSPTDVATFGASSITNISLSNSIEASELRFLRGAGSYTITSGGEFFFLTIGGVGITNKSGIIQNFVADSTSSGFAGSIQFLQVASAGASTSFTNNGAVTAGVVGGSTIFYDTSTAGSAIIANKAGLVASSGVGFTQFFGTSSAATSRIDNEGPLVSNAIGGEVQFLDSSTAGHSVIVNHGGAGYGTGRSETDYRGTSSAADATITNEGGTVSSATGGYTYFFENSTAGEASITNNGSGVFSVKAGTTEFQDTSGAGSATIVNNGTTGDEGTSGITYFRGTATAGAATIFNNGAETGFYGGVVEFNDTSVGGEGTLIANGANAAGKNGGQVIFYGASDAENAMLIANTGSNGGYGGSISFSLDASGGTSRVEIFGNGSLRTDTHNGGVTIGSLEGDGAVFLANSTLAIGSNNLNTVFSGTIADSGFSGSISKTGSGSLILSGSNEYTAGTTVNGGTLVVAALSGSPTGSGAIQINAGTLGGINTVFGAITVGMGSGSGASLAPGISGTGTLTSQSTVTINSDATYICEVDTKRKRSDQVSANGVTIAAAAQLSLVAIGNRTIPGGTVFTVINNTASQPISGTFVNLPDGSAITVGVNAFLAHYEGGTGNDLTLTVQ